MNIYNVFLKADQLNYLELFLRTTLLYFTLFFANKTLGFKQPGIVTPYNFLIAAGISHIAAARMVDPSSRPLDAIAIIIVYTLVMLLVSYGYFKFPSFVSQTPRIIIKDGKIIKKNFEKSQLTIDNMLSILRQKNAFDLKNIKYMIAESTGNYSVAINSNNQAISKSDMGIKTSSKELSQILIYQGRIDKITLDTNKLDKFWVYEQLEKNNISNIKEVYLGVLTPNKELYVNK